MAAGKALPVSEGPLYLEVRRSILALLASGEWKAGEKLPTEAELAERFGVGISTVRAGLADLSAAGVVVKRQGKGTFVVTHDRANHQFRFSNLYANDGTKLSTSRKVYSLRRVRANLGTRKLLRLEGEGPEVLEAKALLTVGERPVALMDLILPADLFSGLERRELEQEEINFYSFYQRRYGVMVLRMEERISARTADAEAAHRLELPSGHPLLLVERIAYTFGNRPVEVRRRLYEGLHHHYLFTHDQID